MKQHVVAFILTTLALFTTFGISSAKLTGNPASTRVLQPVRSEHPRPLSEDETYPYGGRQFTKFVSESFESVGSGSADDFYHWMSEAYESSSFRFPGYANLSFQDVLKAERLSLSESKTVSLRAHAELELCAQVHRMIKKTIPHFSLDRGFEFYYTVKYGERQCFLQSTLISGLLQEMGIRAGAAMVWKNTRGEKINNAHAVCLVRLSNNSDIIVDASEPEPFAKQQGLFLRTADYAFLRPVYGRSGEKIYFYRPVKGHESLRPERVRTLDIPFILSQFSYYRGERTPGALFSDMRTESGLQSSARYLETSVRESPNNPLAVYLLGRIYLLLNRQYEARAQFREAYRLYNKFGWVPDGPREYMRWSKTRGSG